MPARVMKYNPAFLPEQELIDSFVVRLADLDMIVRILRENVANSNQHVLVVGPRGMGKTTLVLRVAAEVRREEDLNSRWYPLVFAEESYQVGTPGQFWLEALFHLGEQTNDERWRRTHRELMAEKDETRLRDRALAQLMDFADAQAKRILLIVENFNMLVAEQLGDSDAWDLRHTLLNEPRIMLLATATRRFDEVENENKAMFEVFKVHQLHPLDEPECGAIWAAVTGHEPTDRRVRPIQILTGGNPRLLGIISSFAAQLSLDQLMNDLVRLVDDHTEYFKSHLDGLAATERRAYVALAELWDPATAREVARAARLEVSETSSLLNRLVSRGAVAVADRPGRTKWYQVAERMYNIYYLMRHRGAPSQRVRALVNFMTDYYGPEEIIPVTRLIAEEACKLDDPQRRQNHYLVLQGILSSRACWERREQILKEIPDSIRDEVSAPSPELKDEVQKLVDQIIELLDQPQKVFEVEQHLDRLMQIAPDAPHTWAMRGIFLYRQERHTEAEQALRKAIELDTTDPLAWWVLGHLLMLGLRRYEEAEQAFHKAVELAPKLVKGWSFLGMLLHRGLSRYQETEAMYKKAIEIDPQETCAWWGLVLLLTEELDRPKEALEVARDFLKDTILVKRHLELTIPIFARLAAAGLAREVLTLFQASPSAEFLEPLVVGLRLDLGEEVMTAPEILEVGKDVAKRIAKERAERAARGKCDP